MWMPNNYIRTHQKSAKEILKDDVAWGGPQPQLDHLPWHLGQTHMLPTALSMEGLHHHSLSHSHFCSNLSQMALIILVLRLLTGAMLLQQHLIRGVCTMGVARKRGLAIGKGRGWEQQWRWLSFLRVALCLLSKRDWVLLSLPICIRNMADPQEGSHWHSRHKGTCPAQGAQWDGWCWSPHHEVACLEPICKYKWRK